MMTVENLKKIAVDITIAINAAGPMGAPSGIVYAALMGKLDLQTYQGLVDLMVDAKLIRKSGNLLFVGSNAADCFNQ